jgi:hypothetical protein
LSNDDHPPSSFPFIHVVLEQRGNQRLRLKRDILWQPFGRVDNEKIIRGSSAIENFQQRMIET